VLVVRDSDAAKLVRRSREFRPVASDADTVLYVRRR
jgi:hypothetical protein